MRFKLLLFFLFFVPFAAAQEWVYLDSGVTNDLNSISCPDERTCYVVGGAPYIGGDGIVLKSEDGGESWEPQTIPVTSPLRGVKCLDTETCYGVGDVIIKTEDGFTWTLEDDRDAILWSIDATSETNAVTVGNLGTNLRTVDGNDWEGYTPTPFDSSRPSFSDIFFASTTEGWIVGAAGTFKYTDDGGASWTDRDTGETLGYSDIFSLDGGETLWACGPFTHIVKSEDAGFSWEAHGIPSLGGCWAIEFANSSFGWLFGNGAIEYSHDGGLTWDVQEGLERLLYFRDLECFGPDLCYGVGDDGTIIRYGEPVEEVPEPVEELPEPEQEEEEERGQLRAVYNDSPVFTAYPECPAFLDDCEAGYNPVPEYGSNRCIIDYTCVEGSIYEYINSIFSENIWEYLNGLNIPGFSNERVNVYITKNDETMLVAGITLENKQIEKITASELSKPSFTVKTTEETLQSILNSENPRKAALAALQNKEISVNAVTPIAKVKLIISKIILTFMK